MKLILATIGFLLFSSFAFGQQSDEQIFNEFKELFKDAQTGFSQTRGKILHQNAYGIGYEPTTNYFRNSGFTSDIVFYPENKYYVFNLKATSSSGAKAYEIGLRLIEAAEGVTKKARNTKIPNSFVNYYFGDELIAHCENDGDNIYFHFYSKPAVWTKIIDALSNISWKVRQFFFKPFEFPAYPNKSETKNDESKDYEAFVKKCNDFYEKEDYSKAIEICTEAIKLKGDNPIIYQIRGLSYFLTPDNPKSGLEALTSIGSANKYAAIADLTKCTQLEPTKPECFYALGYVQRLTLDKNELDKSAKSFSEAIRLKSTDEDVYYQRAEAYREYYSRDEFFGNKETQIRQRWELAVADYTKDIELRPTAIESRVGRGLVYLDLEKYAISVADFTKALDLLNASGKQNPDYRKGILENRARAYLNLGKNTEYCNDMKAIGKACEK